MKNSNRKFLAGAALLALLLTGCTFKAGYNPTYLTSQPSKLGMPGKALVVLEVGEEQRVYAGHPRSFTGSATSLEVALGEVTKQIALKVFGAAFEDGADFRNEPQLSGDYRVIVKPRVARFDYYYNQLKNLGFAITPQIELELSVVMVDRNGAAIFDKTYTSGRLEGDTYMISGNPSEKVNKLLHLTLFKLMTDAAGDLQKAMATNPTV